MLTIRYAVTIYFCNKIENDIAVVMNLPLRRLKLVLVGTHCEIIQRCQTIKLLVLFVSLRFACRAELNFRSRDAKIMLVLAKLEDFFGVIKCRRVFFMYYEEDVESYTVMT